MGAESRTDSQTLMTPPLSCEKLPLRPPCPSGGLAVCVFLSAYPSPLLPRAGQHPALPFQEIPPRPGVPPGFPCMLDTDPLPPPQKKGSRATKPTETQIPYRRRHPPPEAAATRLPRTLLHPRRLLWPPCLGSLRVNAERRARHVLSAGGWPGGSCSSRGMGSSRFSCRLPRFG